MLDSSSLMNEWLSIITDRRDRLREQEKAVGVMLVRHPLCTDSRSSYQFIVQLQTDDRVMPLFYFLFYFEVPSKLESFEDVKLMLQDTAIGVLIDAGWYVVSWFDADGGMIDA